MFFFSAFSDMVLACVFAKVGCVMCVVMHSVHSVHLCLQWYWTRDKRSGLPQLCLTRTICSVAAFHLGTLAFGSLVLAVVRMLRVILEYVERKGKYFNNDLARFVHFTDISTVESCPSQVPPLLLQMLPVVPGQVHSFYQP